MSADREVEVAASPGEDAGLAAIAWAVLDADGGAVRAGARTSGETVLVMEHFGAAHSGVGVMRADPNGTGLLWSVDAPLGAGGSGRLVLYLPRASFRDVLRGFNPDALLSNAEARVVFQLIGGASLREAAIQDRLAVETKRAQFKSACAKLGCSGQIDLVRKVMAQLALLPSRLAARMR